MEKRFFGASTDMMKIDIHQFVGLDSALWCCFFWVLVFIQEIHDTAPIV